MPDLTHLQREVLEQAGDRWLRPMDMGGRDGSAHSGILAVLARKGFVERKSRGRIHSARGSYVYRMTDEGRAALRKLSNPTTGEK